MADKEQLEEIKKSFNFWMEEDESIGLIPEDIDWLIEQAERVQELENENRILRTVAESNKYIGEQYLEQNKRYRKALKGVLDITVNENWSKYEAIALQDSINDFITLKNSDLLEESE